MKNALILFILCLSSGMVFSQTMRCFNSGPDANTKTISALTACGKHFSGSVNGAISYTDTYDCVSGNQWIGGEAIFYFDDVIEGRYTFKIKGFATDLDLFIISSCDENMCLSNEGARGRSGRDESVTLDLMDGQNVYIVVDGKFVSSAVFSLEIKCEGGICDELRSISCGSVKRHSNHGYSATDVINSHPDCGAGSYPQPEVGYYVNTYSSSPITIDLVPESRIDLDLFVYDDCTGKLSNCLGKSASSPWGESVYLSSGGTGGDVIAIVDGKSQSGSYELAVTCGEPCDKRPTKIGCNTVIHSTTKGKSNNASYYGCDPFSNKGQNWGPEEVFEIYLDDTYDIDIRLDIEGTSDLNLYLLRSNCDPASCIEGSKREANGGREQIKERLRRGKYYIVVEGYRGASADYTLSVSGCGCEIKDALECGVPLKGTLKNGKNSVTSIEGECFIKEISLPSEDLVYSFIAKEDGFYSFMLYGMDGSMDLFLTRDCKDPQGCIGSSTQSGNKTDIVNLEMYKGEQVLALVDGLIDAKNSDFFIEVICADKDPEPDPDEDGPTEEEEEEEEDDIPTEEEITALLCGESIVGTTKDKSSVFSRSDYTCFISSLDFKGGEEIIKIEKESDTDVLSVHMFHGQKSLENLSMFIMDSTFNEVDNCKGLNFRGDKTIGNGSVIGEYYTDKDNPLPAGTYYAVLDGYNSRVESDFTLNTSCSALDCESIVGLPCGESLVAESTETSFNGESIYYSDDEKYIGYTGGENIYSFCLDSAATIDVTIYGLKEVEGFSGDLDLFLVENVCSDDKKVIASSQNRGTEDENIKTDLKVGEYYIIVDGWNGARATFSFRNDTCFASTCGKNKKHVAKSVVQREKGSLEVFPNPFTDEINVTYISEFGTDYTISIFDAAGKLVASDQRKSGESNLTDLISTEKSGIFYLQIVDGENIKNQRIIKM